MWTISLLREKKEFITERLKVKNFKAEEIIDRILTLDTTRREIQSRADNMQGEMNLLSRKIGALMKDGKKDEAEIAKEKTYTLKEEIRLLTDKLFPIDNDLRSELIKRVLFGKFIFIICIISSLEFAA